MAGKSRNRKRCAKCGRKKKVSEFVWLSKTKRLYSYCKKCQNAATRARYHANIERERQRSRKRPHTEARKRYLAAYYQLHRERYDRINLAWIKAHPEVRRVQSRREYAKDRNKILARGKDYRRRNPEKISAQLRRYRKNNRELVAALARNYKARKRNAPGQHTGDDIKAMLKKQRGRCIYCPAKLANRYHVDHKRPLSRRGSNGPKNLQLTCPSCNLRKKDKTHAEFAREMGLI